MEKRCHTLLSDEAHMIIVGSPTDVIKSQGKDPSKKISDLKKIVKSQLNGKLKNCSKLKVSSISTVPDLILRK